MTHNIVIIIRFFTKIGFLAYLLIIDIYDYFCEWLESAVDLGISLVLLSSNGLTSCIVKFLGILVLLNFAIYIIASVHAL